MIFFLSCGYMVELFLFDNISVFPSDLFNHLHLIMLFCCIVSCLYVVLHGQIHVFDVVAGNVLF